MHGLDRLIVFADGVRRTFLTCPLLLPISPPPLQDNKEGLDLLVTAIEKAGYTGKVGACLPWCMDAEEAP